VPQFAIFLVATVQTVFVVSVRFNQVQHDG